jgi:hypothetical protein
MSKTDAEYMRAYRARRKAEVAEMERALNGGQPAADVVMDLRSEVAAMHAHIVELEKGMRMSKDVVAQADALARSERAKREELEAEVEHLKAELAKREPDLYFTRPPAPAPGSFNTRPFTPVPRQRDKAKGK